MDRYPIQNYNGKNVICFEFTTNYPWSVSAPHYINIHNKETCEPITNGGAGTYSLYIWMDSDLYWGKIIGSIKDHHYSEISKPQEITFNVQGAVFSYSIDPFHINEIPAHDYFANKVSEISDFATDGKYDIIDYICGRVITGGSTKTLYYKDNKFYCFKSELIDEFSLSIDYSVKEPANTSIDSHSYIVNDDIFYTVPFDLYSIAVASVHYKTAYKGVLDFSGGSAGISVHIYPGTILELDQNGFCTWCYNPTNDNDYTYWYFYDSLDHMVKMN
ncbi:MAG: hypothetical protein IJL67_12150 [Oscillospiraceae bacterium]|nr:hypothetical protein [Oscillospiraceae bacterium]